MRDKWRDFANEIFKCIFLDENIWISIKIPLKFVPKGPIDKKVSFGSGDGLVPSMRQAIIWTSTDLVNRRIYAAHGDMS